MIEILGTGIAEKEPARLVVVLTYPQVRLLDVAGPVEVFATAAALGAPYRVLLCSRDSAPITTLAGATLLPAARVSDLLAAPEPIHTLLVPGGANFGRAPVPPELIADVQALAPASQRTAAVCTGAFALAIAGLLDGRRATTHWQHTATLAARHPAVTVQPDALYVKDDPVWTSAGVSAGIDLALALVEDDHGPDLARATAQEMVVFLHRPGGQSQFSVASSTPRPTSDVLRALLDSISADPASNHDVPALAARAGLSSRHLSRLFRQHLGATPAAYVEAARLERAKQLLQRGHTVTTAAQRSGIGSDETLRRVFLRHHGITPSAHRARFSSTNNSPTDTPRI